MPSPDPARARTFAALLARPRLCGTEEERAAAGRIREAFREAGLETAEEFFHFRPSGDRVVREGLAAGLAGLALVYAGGLTSGWLAVAGLMWLAVLAVSGAALARSRLLARAREARETDAPPSGWVRASNVIGRSPGPAGGPLVVFVAHYDSKSQNMPIAVRMALFAVLGVAGVAGVELALARIVWGSLSPAFLHVAFAAALLPALALLTLKTGNASPGALDNASGVGILVELARIWRDHPLSGKARAVFLAPSAEEHGLIGSWLWVRRHAAELRGEGRLWVLNFDSCAGTSLVVLPGRCPASGGVSVSEAFLSGAKSSGIRVRSMPLGVGMLADHVPFIEAGFSCASLLARSRSLMRIHTPGDSADLLEDEGFEAALRTTLAALGRLVP